MAQGNIEGTQGSRTQSGKSGAEAQSDKRRQQQGAEQQASRQTGGLQRRSPALAIPLREDAQRRRIEIQGSSKQQQTGESPVH